MTQDLRLTSIVAHAWHCDHFGHLNVRHYAAAFDDALFIFWARLGLPTPVQGQPATIPVTASTRTDFRAEIGVGTVAALYGRPLTVGGKSVTLAFDLRDEASGTVFATCEVVEVFFDMQARDSRPIPDSLRAALAALGAIPRGPEVQKPGRAAANI